MKKRIRHSITGMILCFLLCVSLILTAAVPVQAAEGDTPADESFTVPRIVVTTEGGNGTALQKSDGYVGAHITITGLDGSVLDSDAQIKVRGNTTALSWIEKKSFTFKFGTKKDVLGMGKGKKWVVVSNVFDPTLLRNFLAFETADELGLAYTSRHQFVELWLDGSFRGSYVLFEPVQEGKDRVDIDIESNGGKKDFLVEYETETAMQDPDDTYFKAGGHRFIASDPDEPTEEQLAYIQDVLTDIINTIKSGDEAKEAASFEFIKFCVNPENQAKWSANTGYFPINVQAQETETFKANLEKYPQFQVALDQLHASGPEYVGSLLSVFPEVRQYVEDVTEKVFQGQLTAEQGVEELVNLANDAIETYNLVNY